MVNMSDWRLAAADDSFGLFIFSLVVHRDVNTHSAQIKVVSVNLI